MSIRQRWFALVLAIVFTSPSTASAQSPWTVSVTPTMDPLPIGACGAVRLSVLDASGKDVPRNPSGARVTIADFDMGVTADDRRAVVGSRIDDFHWSVCACQSAVVGSIATITATYPASTLSEKSRVADVRIESSAPVTIKARMGDQEPAGCAKMKAEQSVAEATSIPRRLTPIEARGSPRTPVPTETVATTPEVSITKPTAGAPIVSDPLPAGKTGGRLPAAAAPSNVVANGFAPLIANITWTEAPNATRYAVWRGTSGTVSVERTSPGFSAKQFIDTLPDPRPVYQYTVIAHYADGTSGAATAVPFTSPALVNPAGFVVKDRGLGNVDFAWRPVGGAVRYRLDGPGIPGTGFYTKDTSTRYPKIPAGPGTWKITALYAGNYADYATGTTASTVVHVLPAHSKQWLTHRNGAGTLAQVQTPRYLAPLDCDQRAYRDPRTGTIPAPATVCRREALDWNFKSGLLSLSYGPDSATWLGENIFAKQLPNGEWATDPDGPQGFVRWLDIDLDLWTQPEQFANEAVYGNPLDLGVGRRAACAQRMMPAPDPGLKTVCYATAHGPVPGTAGFNDLNTINHPEAGVTDDFILSMVIVKEPAGTTFLVLSRAGDFTLLPTVKLDTEGPKIVPFACISCHGGTYNATTRRVDGASFLPLDPGMLSFSSPSEQAAQEEKIRKINHMIRDAQQGTAIAQYLNGLYNGAIGTVGALAQPDYVPASWAPQAGFYRQVVRPYCAMCHLAGPPSWNFASWQNFQDNSALIYADVCAAHTMPHAEVPFKSFWTKETGSVYLPGLLAATIGKPSC
jgi:hypothetical protein